MGFVVGVEQVVVERLRRAVAGQEGLQQEGLEEPADMRQVPLRRADVGHALDHLILGGQRRADRLAGCTHLPETLQQSRHTWFRYRANGMAHGASPWADAGIGSNWN
ncbi:hypothetical protein D3C80_1574260 [compost metagenome]